MPKKTTKSNKKANAFANADKTRQLKQPRYKSFRLSHRVKHPTKLPSAWRLFKQSFYHLKNNWRVFVWIILVYAFLTIVLVKGLLGTSNLSEVKATVEQIFTGAAGQVGTGLTIFGFLVSDSASPQSDSAAIYQSLLMVVFSLAAIFALRQTYANKRPSRADVFYKSQYPLIGFLCVLFVIGIQLLPFGLSNFLFSIVFGNGLAVTLIEQVLWAILLFLLALLSLYMISSSFFALYIITLQDMTPMRALRSAREIVRYRRWTVLRKLLVLPIFLIIGAALIMLPLILYLTPLAEWIFFGLSMTGVVWVHSYGYALYRELL
ncbi:MAG: hypothetical protein AAB459_02345 [Patescibacteria group bacterium]|mgnify:CR=1 FL=1